MNKAILCLTLLLQALAAAPALAQEACPDTCPEGYVRSVETGKCVPIAPIA